MYLVRQAVEAITLHPGGTDLARERNQVSHGRLPAVKAGVEAGDLRDVGKPLGNGIDRRQVVRLMERRERNQRAKFLHHVRRDQRGRSEPRPTVDDAMADTEDAGATVGGTKPGGERIEGGAPVAHHLVVQRVVGEASAGTVPGRESRRGPDAFDLPSRFESPGFDLGPPVDAELQAR